MLKEPVCPGEDIIIDDPVDVLTDSLAKSIDRSRKRLLSPRALRGDQAVDRLHAQEASASPLLKKSKLKPAMALPAEFYSYMEQNITKRFDNIEADISEVKKMKSTLVSVHETVRANSAKISEQDSLINDNRVSIAAIRDELRLARVGNVPSSRRAMPVLPLRSPVLVMTLPSTLPGGLYGSGPSTVRPERNCGMNAASSYKTGWRSLRSMRA